ncbi:MAG: COR domain-containing protein, partial [Cyanobacteria bacterium J06636_27]
EPGDVKEILDFYFRIQDPNETEPLYEAKLLIVGEGEAGKTSLAKKIEDENYQLQPNEKSTEGIDVIQWKFPLPNGKEFRVNIWDFGGQEIYHQTHQFFLSERSLYVLVADNRRENPNFYWWLKVVELLSGNSPVLIIKNEKQERQCEVNERELRGEFTNLKEVLATNLATNRGLEQIKQKIQLYISNLDHIGDKSPLPKLWVRVRLAIENYSRNYISREEYYQFCKTNELRDRKDMLRLSRHLHDLGVFLHFQEDSTLKHYVILKPEWATTAVYKVLDNQTVINELGCFTQAQLADIWQDSEYSDMQDELLQLMMRFKLCYPIPNRPGNYIAPQLLDIEQPTYNWDKSHNLILRYKYDFMPKGILTRFIVETHPWIEQQKLVWKSGVVLNKDETRAEVIENYNQREIKVRLWGNCKKDLLMVVNHELEKIHLSYERLKYETLVPCNCSECIVSENPYSYPLENLRRRLEKGKYEIECEKSFEKVNVRRLIDDVNLSLQAEYRESNIQSTQLQQELETARNINFNVNIHNDNQTTSTSESTNMSNINDQSRNVSIGGDASNISSGAFNLGEISGTVANTINQLPASSKPEEPGIKELLEQLKTAIESEDNLSDDDKKTALEQVQTLAEAGQKPQEGTMQKLAKTAMLALRGVAAGLPSAAKLADSVNKLLPMISKIFGF